MQATQPTPNMMTRPKGIQRIRTLPDNELDALWHSIIVDDVLKDQLLSQAVLNFTVRPEVKRSVLPLHGVILLVGSPGTGKTSLAQGLANQTAKAFGEPFQLLEVDPHALISSAMGKTQQAVSGLFAQTIAEAATQGPTVVLLDEVETLAANRSKMSLEANPIDIHRATDAVLVQLDHLAEEHPNLLFLATSNFPDAVDRAFTSRCDLVLTIPLPNADACERILKDCLTGLAQTYPAIEKLINAPQFEACAEASVGLDGRTLRKMVANALASTKQVAMDPNLLTLEQLTNAARSAVTNRQGS